MSTTSLSKFKIIHKITVSKKCKLELGAKDFRTDRNKVISFLARIIEMNKEKQRFTDMQYRTWT